MKKFKEEMRIYIKISFLSGHSVDEIYNDLNIVYKENAYSKKTIRRWIKKIDEEKIDFEKKPKIVKKK